VDAGRGDSITLGIENRDSITVVALVMKYKLVSVIAMCAGCHLDLLHETYKIDGYVSIRLRKFCGNFLELKWLRGRRGSTLDCQRLTLRQFPGNPSATRQ